MPIGTSDAHDRWIAGTADAAPVTPSTPELPTPELPVAAAEGVTPPAPEVTPGATDAPTPAGEPAAAAAAPPEAPAPPSVPAPPVTPLPWANVPEAELIEVRYGDQTLRVPRTLQLPWKRGEETGFASVEDIRRDHMLYRDYQAKTAELAAQRRAVEVEQRKADELKRFLAEEQARVVAAQKDPEALARYEQHVTLYQSDPQYRAVYDAALTGRLAKVELDYQHEVVEQEAVQQAATYAQTTIQRLAAEFPGVAPERVQATYAEALAAGRVDLSEQAIRSVYQSEAQAVTAAVSPLQQEVAALKQQLAALAAQQTAAAHNSRTAHEVARATAPTVVTGQGAPPATPGRVAPTPYTSAEAEDRRRAWVQAGRP